LPDLLRRVAALTAISVIGIVLLAPMAVRSALAEPTRTQALLEAADAADAARAAALPRGSLIGRDTPAALSLALPGTGADAPEALSRASVLPTPAAAPMEATLFALVAPARAAAPVDPSAFAVDDATWDLLAMCESSGNWAANTGNGYYGGLQFSLATWQGYGGDEIAAYPHQATREQQIAIAERLYARRGFQPWPACRAELGLP
jgi:Transglycosylase-like domain